MRLIIFSDEWGEHPSSCQHLTRRLVQRYPVLWVNTIGTRLPRLSLDDLRKVVKKLRQWARPPQSGAGAAGSATLPANMTLVTPRMYPGFRKPWQRRFNARRIAAAVNSALGPRRGNERRIVISTLPLMADVVAPKDAPGHTPRHAEPALATIDAERWVYYCVDDFSVWPGLDGTVIQDMEARLVERVDAAVAVSDSLIEHLSDLGIEATLLTHGIDLDMWRRPSQAAAGAGAAAEAHAGPAQLRASEHVGDGRRAAAAPDAFKCFSGLPRPIILFWGLIDPRLDVAFCRALLQGDEHDTGGTLVLIGPQQAPDPALAAMKRLVMPGPVAYHELPAAAAAADVLVMPYADLPVTRAMQPLKFKEYLATGKPVVARALPSNRQWADAADIVADATSFAKTVRLRAGQGIPAAQVQARQCLADETWDHKAAAFEAVILGQSGRQATEPSSHQATEGARQTPSR